MFGQKRGASVSHWSVAVIASCLVIGLSGCVANSSVKPSSAPSSSETTVALSEKEALDAMRAAYEAYVEVSDQVYSEGGTKAERIDDVAVGSAAEDFKAAAFDLESRGFRTIGATTTDSFRLQNVVGAESDTMTVTAYVCSDVSAVDVVDAGGVSQVSADRNARTPYEVVVEVKAQKALVVSRDVWVGDNYC